MKYLLIAEKPSLMRDLKAAGLPVREDITTADEAVAEILRALNQRIE